MVRNRWTQDEMLLTLCIYSTLPYPKPVDALDELLLARLLPTRSLDSIKLRLANFIARDPIAKELGQRGMYGGGRHVDEIWWSCSDERGNLSQTRLIHRLLSVLASRSTNEVC